LKTGGTKVLNTLKTSGLDALKEAAPGLITSLALLADGKRNEAKQNAIDIAKRSIKKVSGDTIGSVKEGLSDVITTASEGTGEDAEKLAQLLSKNINKLLDKGSSKIDDVTGSGYRRKRVKKVGIGAGNKKGGNASIARNPKLQSILYGSGMQLI
jgi:hypothetical protein